MELQHVAADRRAHKEAIQKKREDEQRDLAKAREEAAEAKARAGEPAHHGRGPPARRLLRSLRHIVQTSISKAIGWVTRNVETFKPEGLRRIAGLLMDWVGVRVRVIAGHLMDWRCECGDVERV